MTALDRDMDVLISDSVRSFKSGCFLKQVRRRPCAAQLRLLNQRLANVSLQTAQWKSPIAWEYRRSLPPHVQVGVHATFPGHWVYPILVRQPELMRARLWRRGFDATARGSQLRVVPAAEAYPEWHTPQATEWVPRLIYLPLHHALTTSRIAEIASVEQESVETCPAKVAL